MDFVSRLKRSHYCGELRNTHEDQEVILMGWVDRRRDHGGLVFIDLRDREGLVQVVLDPGHPNNLAAKEVRNEYVMAVKGRVRIRPAGMANDKIPTGEIEVVGEACEILSEAAPVPMHIGDEKVSESLRLKYRYLELRSPKLQQHLQVRHRVAQIVRSHLSTLGFVEVETPILYKSTPEGARDYLVPSRVHLGHFYALPQSPQTLKQLLMVGGMDRYFQIARCFRDEDLRADRQPEFSQIDMEMSFVDEEDLISINENLARQIWSEVKGVDIGSIPRLTYQEVMNRFGSDKPDLRNPLELKDLGKWGKGSGFKVFEDVLERGGVLRGLAGPGTGNYSRGQLDKLTDIVKQMGAKGLVWIKADTTGTLTSSVSKFLSADIIEKMFQTAGGEAGGGVFVVADEFHVASAALAALRDHLGHQLGLVDLSRDSFLWVVDFPLFEYDAELKRWVARHHPFTSPKNESLEVLLNQNETEYPQLIAKAYDFVCNGYEIAGGSIRIHNQKVQSALFKALGLSDEEVAHQFGFFIEALSYGTPPHGGIAWGMDRLIMLLVGTTAIRDVIAFPKTAKATCLMSDAPSTVSREQLLELGIRLGTAAELSARQGKN